MHKLRVRGIILNLSIYFFVGLFLAVVSSSHQSSPLDRLATEQNDQYHENLFIRPLVDGKLFTQFQFRTIYRRDIKSLRWENKIQIFPLSIAELISASDANALHFSLTRGNWNYKNWGYASYISPPGSQIRVDFSNLNKVPGKSWAKLINLLSGKFCASLQSASEMMISSSKLFFADDPLSDNFNSSKQTYYANLPEETLCTENLTPWKKLLPCYSNSGLASLLNPKYILHSSFSSLSIDIEPQKCLDMSGRIVVGCEQVQSTQVVTIVFNPLNLYEGKQTWSIAKIFGNSIKKLCPLASSSLIHVDMTDLDDKKKIYPQSFHELKLDLHTSDSQVSKRNYAVFDLLSDTSSSKLNKSSFNLGVKQNQLFKYTPSSIRPSFPVYLQTHIAGFGASYGTIVAKLTNNANETVTLTYIDTLPYFMRVYLHTLKIMTAKGNYVDPKRINFVPSRDNNPTLIEVTLQVPPNEELKLSYDFERVFLKWTDYKPGANKGVLIGSSSAKISHCCQCLNHLTMPTNSIRSNTTSIKCSSADEDDAFKVFSRPLLLIQPTPDFSMPYNVICLFCSVLVAGFGPIYNLTTKKPKLRVEKKASSPSN